eukprot:1182825-Prorocentrum_minimum.AAC.3
MAASSPRARSASWRFRSSSWRRSSDWRRPHSASWRARAASMRSRSCRSRTSASGLARACDRFGGESKSSVAKRLIKGLSDRFHLRTAPKIWEKFELLSGETADGGLVGSARP